MPIKFCNRCGQGESRFALVPYIHCARGIDARGPLDAASGAGVAAQARGRPTEARGALFGR